MVASAVISESFRSRGRGAEVGLVTGVDDEDTGWANGDDELRATSSPNKNNRHRIGFFPEKVLHCRRNTFVTGSPQESAEGRRVQKLRISQQKSRLKTRAFFAAKFSCIMRA